MVRARGVAGAVLSVGKVVPALRLEGSLGPGFVRGDEPLSLTDLADLRQRCSEPLAELTPCLPHGHGGNGRQELVVLAPREGKVQRIGRQDPFQLLQRGRYREVGQADHGGYATLQTEP